MKKQKFTYEKSGVSISAADKFVKFISNISTKNKDIEEQTNYLESKINSYNDNIEKNESNKLDKSKIENTKSEVVNIRKNINKSEIKSLYK